MWGCPAPNATSWEAPTDPAPFSYEEMKLREPQIHPNYIKQMIPFWRSGIVAAERGYVLKMEEFLDGINQDGWEIRGGEWWAGEESTSGTPTCTLQTCKAMAERRRGFVEKYAEERGADGERRRRMHEFFEVEN
jgi:hypothetical protein